MADEGTVLKRIAALENQYQVMSQEFETFQGLSKGDKGDKGDMADITSIPVAASQADGQADAAIPNLSYFRVNSIDGKINVYYKTSAAASNLTFTTFTEAGFNTKLAEIQSAVALTLPNILYARSRTSSKCRVIKLSNDYIMASVPVRNGRPSDHKDFYVRNVGAMPRVAATHAWRIESILSKTDGIDWEESNYFDESSSIFEFRMLMGLADMSDGVATEYPYEHNSQAGVLTYTGAGMYFDANTGVNFRDTMVIGQPYECTRFEIQQQYTMKLRNGTTVGTLAIVHIFSGDEAVLGGSSVKPGCRVIHAHTISVANLGYEDGSYGMMMPWRDIDTVTAYDSTGAEVGSVGNLRLPVNEPTVPNQVGNWTAGNVTKMTARRDKYPNLRAGIDLPTLHPGSPPGNWSYAQTSRAFVLRNPASNMPKGYFNWVSRAAGSRQPVALGTHSHVADYFTEVF